MPDKIPDLHQPDKTPVIRGQMPPISQLPPPEIPKKDEE